MHGFDVYVAGVLLIKSVLFDYGFLAPGGFWNLLIWKFLAIITLFFSLRQLSTQSAWCLPSVQPESSICNQVGNFADFLLLKVDVCAHKMKCLLNFLFVKVWLGTFGHGRELFT
jgi:hypothetical protein